MTKYKVEQELILLKNALIALRKGKVHIVEDHLDRVITNLEKYTK